MLRRSCREVTRLVLEGQDRRLSWFERLVIGLHLKVCKACPRFARQVELMKGAMGRWRDYRDRQGP